MRIFQLKRSVALALASAFIGAPAGWLISDRIEQDNDFCKSCHLASGVPLHIGIRRGFDTEEPSSLAALHGRSLVVARGRGDAAAFRCIDCHGGKSFVGRVRVKALAAKDAFWYTVGHFEEPEKMSWPLWDEDCLACHTSFDEREAQGFESPRFHQLAVHNVDLGVDCVECHQVHESAGDRQAFFLVTERVRANCARCHARFGEQIQ